MSSIAALSNDPLSRQLFNRAAEVNVGGSLFEIGTLRFSFDVHRSVGQHPNTATIELYNAGQNTRAKLSKGTPIILAAGYIDSVDELFSGEITQVSETFNGPDRITVIEAEDSGIAYQTTRINENLPKGTTLVDAAMASARATGLGLGNLSEVLLQAQSSGKPTRYQGGVVLSGRAIDQFAKVMQQLGLTWSVQSGAIQALSGDAATTDVAVVLSSGTGLVGSPVLGSEGALNARSLLQGQITPGRAIIVAARNVEGTFRAETVRHYGDTWGSDWYTELEATPI